VFSGIFDNKSVANLYKLDTFLEAVQGCLPEWGANFEKFGLHRFKIKKQRWP
jgi:hypothetical protein